MKFSYDLAGAVMERRVSGLMLLSIKGQQIAKVVEWG